MRSFLTLVLAASVATAFPSAIMKRHNGTASNNTDNYPTMSNDTAKNNVAVFRTLLEISNADGVLYLIPNDIDFVYDFNHPWDWDVVTSPDGSRFFLPSRITFPPLVATRLNMGMGRLGPCGYEPPHTHPRSSEILFVVKGRVNTEFGMGFERRTVNNSLTFCQMTIFPMGAMHTLFNPDCTEALYTSSFANEDPGIQRMSESFLGLSNQLLSRPLNPTGKTPLNASEYDKFTNVLTPNVAVGVQKCLKKCGLCPSPKASK